MHWLAEEDEAAPARAREGQDAPVQVSLADVRADLLGTQRRLAAEHGGFTRYRVLRRAFTLVADADANNQMFVRKAGNYRRGPQYDDLALVIGRGLICSEGDAWQRQRRMAQPAFGKDTLARVVQNTGTLTTQLLADWEQAARHGEPVDVLDDMQHLAMRVIGMALFSRDLENDLQAGLAGTAGADPRGARGANCFTETVRSGVQVVALRNFSPVPLPLWVPTRLHRRFRRGLAAVDRFVYARIDERLADPGGYDDMLADLVRSYGDQAAAADTRRELRDQVVTLFFAGFETTAVALAWTWLLLGQHQAAEDRFHQELAAVLGGRAPAAEDLKALGYTGQVVQESLRMYPPVYTLTRQVVADDEIAGHQVRSGDNVVIPIHALHHMPEYWDSPGSFCPERFAPGEPTEQQHAAYLPFSFGQRRCLGAGFATVEMMTVLAVAGQRVRLRPASAEPVTIIPAVTQRPAGGLPMLVEVRS
jgi:cytochrome P450